MNTGLVEGLFTVSISECTYPVLPVPLQYPFLASNQSTEVVFEVSQLPLLMPAYLVLRIAKRFAEGDRSCSLVCDVLSVRGCCMYALKSLTRHIFLSDC